MPEMKKVSLAINFASTIDGKIAPPARGRVRLGSPYDRELMSKIRARADAVLIGATTFKAHPDVLKVQDSKRQPATVILSSRLEIPLYTKFLKARSVRRLVFCGRKANKKHIAILKNAGVEVVQSRRLRPSVSEILKNLQRAGLSRLLLEGGGETTAAFFHAAKIDRIYLTLCPEVLGGRNSPTLFEGEAFSLKRLPLWRLNSCQDVTVPWHECPIELF